LLFGLVLDEYPEFPREQEHYPVLEQSELQALLPDLLLHPLLQLLHGQQPHQHDHRLHTHVVGGQSVLGSHFGRDQVVQRNVALLDYS